MRLLMIMLKTYFKQALALFRQNCLFSTLYIAGTGLAIAMTVVMALVYYVKLAPVYPEANRANTLYLTHASFHSEKQKATWQAGLSYQALQDWVYPLKNAAAVSARLESDLTETGYIQPADRSGDFHPALKLVDPAFFRVYPFRFLEGKPFTDADLESGLRAAVISDDLARRLFGAVEGAVGRSFSLDYVDCRVCGVVRGASYLTPQSYAQVYLPYSADPAYREALAAQFPYCGSFSVTFLVEDGAQADALRAEIADAARRLNLQYRGQWQMELWKQPTAHWLGVFQSHPSDADFNPWKAVGYLLVVVLVLLLVPALNLSGLIASRMESRLAEMGVRKSFGAGRGVLLSQVMWENFFLTLAGGLLGLVLAWTTVCLGREWIFTLLNDWMVEAPQDANVYVSGEMLFAPAVFGIAFLLCLALNLLSALLPAWLSLRKPIVYSLYEKR